MKRLALGLAHYSFNLTLGTNLGGVWIATCLDSEKGFPDCFLIAFLTMIVDTLCSDWKYGRIFGRFE